jgi:hypothetical protein
MTAALDLADRLAKICGMFGSHHAGERSAAAAKADSLVRAAGLTWPDVIRLPSMRPAPEIERPQLPWRVMLRCAIISKARRVEKHQQIAILSMPASASAIGLSSGFSLTRRSFFGGFGFCRARVYWLRPRDQEFIMSLCEADILEPSKKQLAWLINIYARLYEASR